MLSRPYVQRPGWNNGMNLELQADYLGKNTELKANSPAINMANKERKREINHMDKIKILYLKRNNYD